MIAGPRYNLRVRTLDYLALVPPARRRRITLITLTITALLGLALALLDRALTGAGDGTIAFELAGSAGRAAEIVDTWRRADVLVDAALITGIDFLYAVAYSFALGMVCIAAAMHWRGRGERRRAEVAWRIATLMPLAGALDWLENVALATSLLGSPSQPWPALALLAAIAKFGLIAVGLGTAIAGGVSALAAKR